MANFYREPDCGQPFLLPLDMADWVHLGPVQRAPPEPHQTRRMAQLQTGIQAAPAPLAEPCDHAVVGNLGAHHDHSCIWSCFPGLFLSMVLE